MALACIPLLFPDAFVRGQRHPWPLLTSVHAPLLKADTVISTSPLAHAIIWQTRRRDLLVAGWPGEFDGGMQPDEDLARLVPTDRLIETIRSRLGASRPGDLALVAGPGEIALIDAAPELTPPNARHERDGVCVLIWSSP
jgi:hypothetical protein